MTWRIGAYYKVSIYLRPKTGVSNETQLRYPESTALSNVVEYLLDLAADPDRSARFKADPESELRTAPLTDSEKSALATRNEETIQAAINNQTPDEAAFLRWLASLLQESGD